MENVKMYFVPETTREAAEELIQSCDGTMDMFSANNQIGCNLVTFAMASVPNANLERLGEHFSIKRMERIPDYRDRPCDRH